MINIKNLSKTWPGFEINNITLEIKNQEYFVILGPTGAGKTLLLELIAGFYQPDKGKIEIKNNDITDLNPEKRNLGFVYQDYSLFPHLTVEENIKFGPEQKEFSDEKISVMVQQVVEMLGIEHLSDRYSRTLSGGERQKVALARGLVTNPDVLLLDEPLSALDTPSQEEVRRELKRIHNETGVTTLHVTHNREEAILLGDRIGVMNKGKIIQVGEPSKIFRKPESEFVANFVGVDNIFDGESKTENGIAKINIGQGIKIAAVSEREGKAKAMIRPEEIIISKNQIKTSGRNLLEGEIVEILDRGTTVKLWVDAGREFAVTVTRKSYEDMNLKIGMQVYLAFKASSVHII